MGRYVAALNQHRRSRIKPLTLEEERAKAEAAIREHPEWTDRRIAEACGVSHPFVAKVRTEMSSGNVPRRTEMQPLVQSSEKTGLNTRQTPLPPAGAYGRPRARRGCAKRTALLDPLVVRVLSFDFKALATWGNQWTPLTLPC
jgi:hypothetical protein